MSLKHFIILTFVISFACISKSGSLFCTQNSPFLDYGFKKLTGSWHLEYIGADLAKEFVSLINPIKIRTGILDTGITQQPDSCRTSIRTNISDLNTLADKIHAQIVADAFFGEYGATSPAIVTNDSIAADDFRNKREAFSELKKSTTFGLRILNYSMEFNNEPNIPANHPSVEKLLSEFGVLDRNGIIIVTSSGNNAAIRASVSEFKERFPGIVVGAFGPDGVEASFSQRQVDKRILAPGLGILQKSESDLKLNNGTSISSPLVAGSIANVLSISPTFTRNNIELLIEKTGIKLKNSAPPSAIMINSYKMIRVAKKIQDQLSSKKFTSINERERFIARKIIDPETNNFSTEIDEKIKSAAALQDSESCDDLIRAIKLFREIFMLSESVTAKAALVKLYEKIGFGANSDFYKTL